MQATQNDLCANDASDGTASQAAATKAWSRPTLYRFGALADLTAAGAGRSGEVGNQGAQKRA